MSVFYGLGGGEGEEGKKKQKLNMPIYTIKKKEHGNTACRIPYMSTRVITILCSETRSYNARERLSVSGGGEIPVHWVIVDVCVNRRGRKIPISLPR